MTTSNDLLTLVVAAIATPSGDPAAPVYPTDAGARVYEPGDWPTQQEQYPIVKLRLTAEDRQSIGRSGPPEYVTTATVEISAEVSYLAEAGNAGATKAGAAAWALKRQIDIAVVNSYPLTSSIQQIASMNAQLGFDSSSGTHIAAAKIALALEFYEGPESFAPVVSEDVDELALTASGYPPTGFVADLQP